MLLYLGSHLLFEGVCEHCGHLVDLLNFDADFTLCEWASISAVARRLEFLEQFFSALTLLLKEVLRVGLPGLVFHLFRQLCHELLFKCLLYQESLFALLLQLTGFLLRASARRPCRARATVNCVRIERRQWIG